LVFAQRPGFDGSVKVLHDRLAVAVGQRFDVRLIRLVVADVAVSLRPELQAR